MGRKNNKKDERKPMNQRQMIANLSQEIHNDLQSGFEKSSNFENSKKTGREARKEKKNQKKLNKLNNYNRKRGIVINLKF